MSTTILETHKVVILTKRWYYSTHNMQLFPERPQPHWIDKLAVALAVKTNRRELLQSAGTLIGGALALRLGIAKAQPNTADLKPCGDETGILKLCYDARQSEPENQGIYRRYARAGHPEDYEVPFWRRICDETSTNPPDNPQTCVDSENNPVKGATMADLSEPKYADALADPVEKTVPEPTLQPVPITAGCPDLPTPARGLLFNGKIARPDRVNWDKTEALEDIRDISRREIREVLQFISWNMNPGSEVQLLAYRCRAGQWDPAGRSVVRVTINRIATWALPYKIPEDTELGERAVLWTVNGQGAEQVRFRIIP